MSLNQLVDAVFVLSVRSFADRIAHMRAEMQRHGIDFEFVFEHDAYAIPPELIARHFAPSDMRLPHQSLVLKHMHTWRLALERHLDRVLVLEDDAVLAADFNAGLAGALQEAAALGGPWTIYLGRGNNQHVGGGGRGALMPGGKLPATDALLFNREAAQRRLAYLENHKITRPADWLIRETDAAVGVPHFWLRRPLVEQGSMNGRFDSVLDDKRSHRSRWINALRYRWDAWWKRLRQDLGWRQYK